MTPDVEGAVEAEILAGRQIAAIKRYRVATGASLADAKAYVDGRTAELASSGKLVVRARPAGPPVLLFAVLAGLAAVAAQIVFNRIFPH
jgi:hypothetical protein